MFKKTIESCAQLDLRNYSAEALRQIKKIEMCAIIIIPSDADMEWYDAFSQINIEMCAETIRMKKDDILKTINGIAVINDKTYSESSHFLVNGIAIIETKEKCPTVSSNGICIKRESAFFNQASNNGMTVIIKDDAQYRTYPNKISLSYDAVSHFDKGSIIIAGNKITLEKDVTEELLLSKKITFIAGNKIICDESVYGYVCVNSQVGNKIEKYDEPNLHPRHGIFSALKRNSKKQ